MSVRDIWRKRKSVYAALKVSSSETTASEAIARFTVLEIDGKNWVAGAVSARPIGGYCYGDWDPASGEVILWNPRTGELRLLNGDWPIVLPHRVEGKLAVYADGFAFFRAWADRRAAHAQRIHAAGETHRIEAEPSDGGIPGALVLGELKDVDWCDTGAAVLVAGPGVDPKKLNSAIIRSARLPRVESLAA